MKPRNRGPKSDVPGHEQPAERQVLDENASESSPLCLLSLKLDPSLRREVDAYADAHGVSRSRAAGQLIVIGRDAIREREGVPGSRADELLEALDGLRASVDILGPPTFGMLRLLAHWASHGGGVKVNEDELLAELRTVGADEWEQAVAETERELQETSDEKDQKERR
jgi:hypothetical protein